MMYRSCAFAILVILGLSANAALAVICFEGTPLDTFLGTYYRFSGEESDGQICVNVARDDADVNRFDFESFQYVVSEVATPIFGGAPAAAGVDFTPTPSGGSSVSFPQNSTVTELCVDVILDDTACENPEDFRIRLISLNPAISTVCSTEAILTISDSTTITVGFTTSTTNVREDAPGVSLSVTRSSRIQNFNVATLSVMEDPNQGGCIAAPGRISYLCIAQRCADGSTTDLTQDVVRSVTLSLVPDDREIDGHRECQILLRPQQGSMCKFNITRGSTQLRVMDDEIVFLKFDMDFYEEDEDKGGVNVTVEMIGRGFIPITASDPVDFNLRIIGRTGMSAAEVGVDLPDREYNSSVPPGESSTSVRILFNPDDIYEQTETFQLVLTPSRGRYNVMPALPFRADVQIANDDNVTVRFPQNLTVLESDGELSFSLSIAEQYDGEICITLQAKRIMAVLDGNVVAATAGEDFENTSMTNICFRNNSRTSDEFTVNILGAAANIPECDEVFSVELDVPPEANLEMVEIPEKLATVTIIDTSDPYTLGFSQSEYRVVEDDGALDVTVTVDRPPAFDIPFTVVASVTGSGPDYAALTNGLRSDTLNREWNGTINSGESNATFAISVVVDNLAEHDEHFNISLSVMSLPKLAIPNSETNVAHVVIEDDDIVEINVAFKNTSREGVDKFHNITFTADGSFEIPFTININFIDGTAENGTDYDGVSQQITFTGVSKVHTVSVPILDDDIREEDEFFQFEVEQDPSTKLQIRISNVRAQLTIEDNDVLTVQFENPAYTLSEGDTITVNVVTSTDFSEAFSVAISHNGGGDLTLSSSILNFSPSSRTASVLLTAVSDNITELDESFTLSLGITDQMTREFGVELGERSTASVTVLDTTEAIEVFIRQNYTVPEGGVVNIVVEVSSTDYEFDFTVTLNHMNGSAGATSDYVPGPYPVPFSTGQTSANLSIQTENDDIAELSEYFKVMIVSTSVPDRVDIGDPDTSYVTIEDNDVITCSKAPENATVTEGGVAGLTVECSGQYEFDFTLFLDTMDGSAVAPGDYTSGGYSLSFTAGQTSGTLSVQTLDDTIAELEEFFKVMITGSDRPGKVIIGDPDTCFVTIQDNDVITCSKAPENATVTEGGVAGLTVECSGQSDFDFTLSLDTMDGSAVAPGDYTSGGYSLSFSAGQTSGTLSVQTLDDTVAECDEFFKVMITGSNLPQKVQIADEDTCFATILDNDDIIITFDPSTYTVMEGSSVEVFLVADRDFSEPFNVTVTLDNTEDVSIQPETVTFEPSNRRVSVSVTALTDDIQEIVETVNLSCIIGGSCLSFDPDPHRAVLSIVDTSSSVFVCFDETAYSVIEGEDITIGITANREFTSSFNVTVTHGDPGGDYEVQGIPVTFSPGDSDGSFKFVTFPDNVKELNESVSLMLQVVNDGEIQVEVCPQSTTVVTIFDISILEVQFERAKYSVSEGDNVTVNVLASNNFTSGFAVSISHNGGNDLMLSSDTITFSPGSSVASVVVAALEDNIKELVESFTLSLAVTDPMSQLFNVELGPQSTTDVEIQDTTAGVQVNFAEPLHSVSEGETITISVEADRDFTSAFTVGVEADNSDDYELLDTSIQFTPGRRVGSIRFRAVQDKIKERNESVTLTLTITDNGGIDVIVGPMGSTSVNIIDINVLNVTLDSTQYIVYEGSQAVIVLTAGLIASEPYTVNIVTSPGTAEEDDFTSVPFEATFNAGQDLVSVNIPTNADECAEPLETFKIMLQQTTSSEALGVVFVSPSEANVTINDTTVVKVSFEETSYSAVEGSSVRTVLVTDKCFEGMFEVDLIPTLGSAEDADFNLPPTTGVTQRNQTVSIDTVDDPDPEGDEEFQVKIQIVSTSGGPNVEVGTSDTANITIIDNDEREVSVSFDQSQYNVKEGDTLIVRFVVTRTVSTPFEVTVQSVNGTAFSGVDFAAVDESVDPRDGEVSVSIFLDDLMEGVETFQLMLIIPDSATGVRPGNTVTATVSIRDPQLRTVNDTIVADPVYAVPLKIVAGAIPGTNGDVSLCYEIHGDADKWFNLISDTCLSVNARYSEYMFPGGDSGHHIDKLGILAVSSTSECREVMVSMVEGVCSATVDGSSTEMLDEDGLVVTKRRNRVRISAPNCNNQMVIIWVKCQLDMMRIVVNRGFNLNPTSHGFLGQFWNIDVSLERYNDTIVKNVYGIDTVNPHYIIHLDPPAPAEKRSLVGELYSELWDRSEKPCLYVGSNQGGSDVDSIKPVGTVVEGTYTDYITNGPFEHSEKFNRFDSSACQSET